MWRKIEEINNDKLLNKKAIKLYDKNDNLYSYHEVEKREVTNPLKLARLLFFAYLIFYFLYSFFAYFYLP